MDLILRQNNQARYLLQSAGYHTIIHHRFNKSLLHYNMRVEYNSLFHKRIISFCAAMTESYDDARPSFPPPNVINDKTSPVNKLYRHMTNRFPFSALITRTQGAATTDVVIGIQPRERDLRGCWWKLVGELIILL